MKAQNLKNMSARLGLVLLSALILTKPAQAYVGYQRYSSPDERDVGAHLVGYGLAEMAMALGLCSTTGACETFGLLWLAAPGIGAAILGAGILDANSETPNSADALKEFSELSPAQAQDLQITEPERLAFNLNRPLMNGFLEKYRQQGKPSNLEAQWTSFAPLLSPLTQSALHKIGSNARQALLGGKATAE